MPSACAADWSKRELSKKENVILKYGINKT